MCFSVAGRGIIAAIALLVASCLAPAPAAAASCKHGWPDETCTKPAKAAKVAAWQKQTPAAVKKTAKARHQGRVRSAWVAQAPYTKVHGWAARRGGAGMYHDGQLYGGGTRQGPALWYNNYEGGFNAQVFWKLADRQGP